MKMYIKKEIILSHFLLGTVASAVVANTTLSGDYFQPWINGCNGGGCLPQQ